MLKEDHKCDLIVALNHMRVPDDINMATTNNTDVLDLIFGGHDHHYLETLKQETGVYIVKSGTDFEVFTKLFISHIFFKNPVQTSCRAIIFMLDCKLFIFGIQRK